MKTTAYKAVNSNFSNSNLYNSSILVDMDKGSLTNATLLSSFYSKNELLLAALIEIFLAVVGTFGNCLVCVAILKNTSLQIAANFYMLSLAIADLLVTAVLVPTRAAQNFALYNDEAVQGPIVYVLSFIGRITILASISSLAVLTNDRRVALKNPLRYRSVIRYAKGRAVKIVLSVWAFSLVLTSITLLPGVTDVVFLIGFASFVVSVTAVIIFAYGNIFLLVRRSTRWRASLTYSYFAKRNEIITPAINSLPRTLPRKCTRFKSCHYRPQKRLKVSHNVDSSGTVECIQHVLNRGTEIEKEESHSSKTTRKHLSTGGTQFDKFLPGTAKKKAISLKKSYDSVSSSINTEEIDRQEKPKLRRKVLPNNTRIDAFRSQKNWGTIDTPTSSSTEKHDLGYLNSVQIELHQERKMRRNTHPKRTQLNSSPSHIERRKTIDLASSVKRKSSCRWKMPRKIEPYTIHPQVERIMNIEQATSAIKSKPNQEGSFNADFEPRCSLKTPKESEQKRTQINPVGAPKAGTNHPYSRKVQGTDATVSRSHDHEVEPGTSNNPAVRHQTISAQPSFGANPSRKTERQNEFRIAKTTAKIVILFILLVYPRIILIIYSLSAGTKAESIHHAKLWIRILLYCNSVVNPFLYSLRHREIWREFLKWCGPCACNKKKVCLRGAT